MDCENIIPYSLSAIFISIIGPFHYIEKYYYGDSRVGENSQFSAQSSQNSEELYKGVEFDPYGVSLGETECTNYADLFFEKFVKTENHPSLNIISHILIGVSFLTIRFYARILLYFPRKLWWLNYWIFMSCVTFFSSVLNKIKSFLYCLCCCLPLNSSEDVSKKVINSSKPLVSQERISRNLNGLRDVEENVRYAADELIETMKNNQGKADLNRKLEMDRDAELKEKFKRDAEDEETRKRDTDAKIRLLEDVSKQNDKLHQDKMQSIVNDSHKGFEQFTKTLSTALHWEQQEREWSNWLQQIRNSIAEVLSTDIGNRPILSKNLEALQSQLCSSFWECGHWYETSKQPAEKKSFLRIIQKSISEVGEINEKLNELALNDAPRAEISNVLKKLSVDMIPTTTKLKEMEGKTDPLKYKNIKEPNSFVIIEEVNE